MKAVALRAALDPVSLADENALLSAITRASSGHVASKRLTPGGIFTRWINDNSAHSSLHDLQIIMPSESRMQVGLRVLDYAVEISVETGALYRDLAYLTIAQTAVQWQLCRALAFLYEWFTFGNPQFTSDTSTIFQELGYHGVVRLFPDAKSVSAAKLLNHCLWFYWTQRSGSTTPLPPTLGPRPDTCDKLPFDLYGLRGRSGDKEVSLETYATKVKKKTIVARLRADNLGPWYEASRALMEEVLAMELVLPPLKDLDYHLNAQGGKPTTSRSSADNYALRDRFLVQAGIIYAVGKAVGTPSIYASRAVSNIITQPGFINSDSITNKRQYISHFLRKEGMQDAFANWLKGLFGESTLAETCAAAIQLGNTINLFVKKSLDGTSPGKGGGKSSTRKLIYGPISRSALASARPQYAVLGLILRETLNNIAGRPPINHTLHRILIGKHCVLSSNISYNPDHTNPIRATNIMMSLFQKHILATELTSAAGLSAATMFFSTGQGWGTQTWLDYLEARGQRFFSRDAQLMVAKFDLETEHNASCSPATRIFASDSKVYGQPSNALSLHPTISKRTGGLKEKAVEKETTQQKVEHCYNSRMEAAWLEWLGDLFEKDPASWEGVRHSWTETVEMIARTKVPGLGGGLCTLQLANTLALVGVAEKPSSAEMADWIWVNNKKGAFKGLEKLGFKLDTTTAVRCAFHAVYSHLLGSMSKDDQATVGLDAIFVEHLLCKVSRWQGRIASAHRSNAKEAAMLERLALEALNDEENATTTHPKHRFPFPLQASEATLQAAINTYGACHIYMASSTKPNVYAGSSMPVAASATLTKNVAEREEHEGRENEEGQMNPEEDDEDLDRDEPQNPSFF